MKVLTSLFIVIFTIIYFSSCGGAQSYTPRAETVKVAKYAVTPQEETQKPDVYYPPPAYSDNPPKVFVQINYRDDGDMSVTLEVGKHKQHTVVKCESKNLDCFFEIKQKESGSRLIYRLDRYDGKLVRPTLLIEGKEVPLGCWHGELATWCENSVSTTPLTTPH